MRSQKVTVNKAARRGRGGGVSGVPAAGASAAGSPAAPKKLDNVAVPVCTVCRFLRMSGPRSATDVVTQTNGNVLDVWQCQQMHMTC